MDMGSDFSIADVAFSDDTNLWGQTATFSGGTTSWNMPRHFYVPSGKSMIGITLYAMYRDDALPGAAFFVDISVHVI
jgi:hypothetical protein